MGTRPTPGGDIDVWGGLVNQALDEIEAKADSATGLAAAAQTAALTAQNINAGVAAQARESAQIAYGHAEAAEGYASTAQAAKISASQAETSAWNAAGGPVSLARIAATGPRNASTFLRGDGEWAIPDGTGSGGNIDGGTPGDSGGGEIDGGTP